MRRPVILLLILLMPPLSARAEGQPDTAPTPEEVAADVLAAQDDEKALGALAARDDPDPWLVADLLEAQGHHEAALQFASAGKGPAIEPLAAYLEKSVRHRGIEDARAGLARALEARSRGVQPALDALSKLRSQRAHVPGVRLTVLRGELLDKAGRHLEAAAAFERAAERAEVIGWHVQQAESLYQSGRLHYAVSAYKEALARFERRLAVETLLGSGIGQARAHYGMSLVHYALGHVDDEARHRNLARTLAEKHGDRAYLARVITADGRVAHMAGDSRRALELYDKAVALIETVDQAAVPARFRSDPVRLAESHADRLGSCASLAMSLGEAARAREYARRSVAVAGSIDDPRVLDESTAFLALLDGTQHQLGGRYLEALSQYDRARMSYKRLGRRVDYAALLRRLAGVRVQLGDRPAAVAAIEEALGILKETGHRREACLAHLQAGEISSALGRGDEALSHFQEAHHLATLLRDAQLEIRALVQLSQIRRMRVEYGEALDLLNDALKIHEAKPKSTDPGFVYTQLSYTYRKLGDLPRAHEYVEAAIRRYEANGAGSALTTARHEKTYVLREQGRHEEALSMLEELTRIYESTANRVKEALTLGERAEVLLDHGERPEWETAADLLAKVVGLHVAAGNRSREITARVQLSRAQVWTDQKDKALAEATYALALAEEGEQDQEEKTGQLAHRVWALAGLAQVHVKRGEYGAAVERAEQAAELIRNYGLDLAEGERAAVRGVFHQIHVWGLAAALAGENTPAVYRFMERGRASGLVASLGGRKALREAHVPRSLRDAEEKANAAAAMTYERYQASRRSGEARATVRARKGELMKARGLQQDAVAAIQRAARAQADLVYPKPVALEELQASLGDADAFVMYSNNGSKGVALVVTRDSTRAVVLPDGEKAKIAFDADDPTPEVVATLRKFLIEPLALTKSTRRVLVSPSGQVAYVPFSLLMPDREICFVPSATTLTLLRTLKVASGDDPVLALGDPVYGRRSPASAGEAALLRGRDLAPLPATRKEATAIGDVVLVGKEASETRFREVLATRKHWRAVHMACHGLVDQALPARSALVLTPDTENDGFLFAGELFAQVPVPADLVVLSACETALGRIYAGEGLVGLARAFMLAGTPRVLASLWKVDDGATQALMLKFYELWNPEEGKGVGAAAALRGAQAYVRSHEKWKAPRFWAAWVLWGLPD